MEVEKAVAELKAERDPLASHIYASRREYRSTKDTKSGKRRDVAARLSYSRACEFGFRGSLNDWEKLMGAAAKRQLRRGDCHNAALR